MAAFVTIMALFAIKLTQGTKNIFMCQDANFICGKCLAHVYGCFTGDSFGSVGHSTIAWGWRGGQVILV